MTNDLPAVSSSAPADRAARWEAAAHAAGREVDRNALAVYMAVADAEQAHWAAYETRLREQHDLDVAELNRLRGGAAAAPSADGPVNDMRELLAVQHAITDAGGTLTPAVHKAIDALREAWDGELRRQQQRRAEVLLDAIDAGEGILIEDENPDERSIGFNVGITDFIGELHRMAAEASAAEPPADPQPAPAVDRIPVAHSVRYVARGLPDLPYQYGRGVLRPAEITLTYRAAPDSQLGRVHAYVSGRLWVDGVEIPHAPYGQHYDSGLGSWPDWLAEEARLHDPEVVAAVSSPAPADLPARLEAVLTERFTELGNRFSEMRRHEQGPDGWPASHPVGPRQVAEVLRELLDAPVPAVDIASADDPTLLRWGLNDTLWGDDDTVTVLLSGPAGEPYWLELDPERAGVLREDLAGPDGAEPLTVADTLPAWLRQRFTSSGVDWENLDDAERSYWEHQARAVRRAVTRGGFKAAEQQPEAAEGAQQ